MENENRLHEKNRLFFWGSSARLKLAFSAVPERMLFVTRRKKKFACFYQNNSGNEWQKQVGYLKAHIEDFFRKSRLSGSEYNFLISFPNPVNVCKTPWPCFLHFYHLEDLPLPVLQWITPSILSPSCFPRIPVLSILHVSDFPPLPAPPSRNFSKLLSLTLLFPSSLPSQHLTSDDYPQSIKAASLPPWDLADASMSIYSLQSRILSN